MKKISIFIICFFLIIFLLPVIMVDSYKKSNVLNEENITEEEIQKTNEDVDLSSYDYKNYKTIKLLHVSTGEVQNLGLDEYLLGVVSAEMPASFEKEALKARAVVARTYTIYSIIHNNGKHEGADICDDSKCCQAWISKEDRFEKWDENLRNENWNKITSAVKETEGKIITYNGEVIDAFFHSNSGGTTETPVNVWGGTGYPYLQSVQTAGEEGYSQYSSEINLTKDEFVNKIKQKYPKLEVNYSDNNWLKIMDYTDSGRVKTLKVGNINISGVEARTLLGLKSANFSVAINENNIVFSVKGYGHGVGMSQTGADSMAKGGSTYEEIIKHFYTGVEIVDM